VHNSHFEIRRQLGESLLTIPGRDEGEGEAGFEFDPEADLQLQRQLQKQETYYVYYRSLTKDPQFKNTLPEEDADEEALADDTDEGFDDLSAAAIDEAEQDAPDYSPLESDDSAPAEELEPLLAAEGQEDGDQDLMELDQATDDEDDDADEEEADDLALCDDAEDDEDQSIYEMPELAPELPRVTAESVEIDASDDYSIQPPDLLDDKESKAIILTDFFRNKATFEGSASLQRQQVLGLNR